MRALVLQEFNKMGVEERPAPAPGEGEVLLDVVATGICGSDLHGYTGANGRRVPGQVMGHETVATVAALGEGVTGLRFGEPVTVNPVVIPDEDARAWAGREHHHPGKYVIGVRPDVVGAFAQMMVVPRRNVVPLPVEMPIEHGALVEPVAVAVHAAHRVQAGSASSCLVIGGGPIGQSLALVLVSAGVPEVIVSEVDAGRRALVERIGARAIDPTARAVPDQVRDAVGGPADVTFDAVGVDATLEDALASTRIGGSVCMVGMGQPRLHLDAFAVSTLERSIVGSFTYSADDFAIAVGTVAGAPDVIDAMISRTVSLADAPEAFRDLSAGDGTPGKILVRLAEA